MVKIFVSFKDEDDDHRQGFEGTLQNTNFQATHVPVSAREDKRPQGEIAVKRYLSELIRDCDAFICLVGNDTYQSAWVNWELDVASSSQIGIGVLKVNNNDVQIPEILKSKHIKIFDWNSDNIIKSIEKAIRFTRKVAS